MNRTFIGLVTIVLVLAGCSRSSSPTPESLPSPAPAHANVPERTNVGNGGSDVLRKFINIAEDLLHVMKKSESVRAYLSRKGVDFKRLERRWSPDKVLVTREDINDYRGSAVDARAATGTVELFEPVWEQRFAAGNDQKEMTLHELLRLYSDPGEKALDDDYQLSREILSILRMSDVVFTTSGDNEAWYNAQLFLGDQGCQASLVQGHIDSERKTLLLSFTGFTLDTQLWRWVDPSYRPSIMFRTHCDLRLKFPTPMMVDLHHAGVSLSLSQADSRYTVGVRIRSGGSSLIYHQSVDATKAVFTKERIGTDVSEIFMTFELSTYTDVMGRFSIEKAVIPFLVREKK